LTDGSANYEMMATSGLASRASNQHYRAEGRNLSDALFTIAKIFGSTVTSVGK
jgi:hypothetical protein